MQTEEYWYNELLTLMGTTPEEMAQDQTAEGKRQVELFKAYVKRIQDDAKLPD